MSAITSRRRAELGRAQGLCLLAVTTLLCACPPPDLDLSDDPEQYVDDVAYRRGILERDLNGTESDYAQERLRLYGHAGLGWEALPERDPPSRAFTTDDIERLAAGQPLARGSLETLGPATLPSN